MFSNKYLLEWFYVDRYLFALPCQLYSQFKFFTLHCRWQNEAKPQNFTVCFIYFVSNTVISERFTIYKGMSPWYNDVRRYSVLALKQEAVQPHQCNVACQVISYLATLFSIPKLLHAEIVGSISMWHCPVQSRHTLRVSCIPGLNYCVILILQQYLDPSRTY